MDRVCAGSWTIDVDPSLIALATPTCHLAPFMAVVQDPEKRLALRRVSQLSEDQSFPLSDWPVDGGRYSIERGQVHVALPDEPVLARRALALAYHQAALAQGGILVHGSAVAWAQRGWAAFGPSGAGKSTLARLCVAEGGQTLSDEIVLIGEDGKVWGSPFWSEPDLAGSPMSADIQGLFVLAQGPTERIEPLTPREALPLLAAQTFDFPHRGLRASQLLRSLGVFLEKPGVSRLTFTKRPQAARWLKSVCLNGLASTDA